MNLTAGSTLHGFEITSVRTVDEINARSVEMRHIRTGAKLLWLDSGAENKLFSIAFKTLPADNTGVFHILEHSVLCGSENFPVKEPFVELLKSSLNTFLNAMTFPDKTVYPVSSRNNADFINLSRVYLDAVFKPAILTQPNIFYQEGWHYEPNGKDGEIICNGVVFNEMKGAYSSVDRVAHQALSKQLYPDSCYGFSSGGEPEHIPELTYEQFLSSYRQYYHPSNSYIYLDGNVPLDEILTIINDEYLSGFKSSAQPVEPASQAPVASAQRVCEYEIGSDETPDGKALRISGSILCDWSDREKQLAAYILGQYLTGSNDAPLKKAILDAGLAQDVTMSIDDGIAQPGYYLLIRNTSYENEAQLHSVITTTAQRLIDSGLDRESLVAAINHLEFNLREGEEPMGLERAINALSSWLYGGDPLLYLTNDEVFTTLRKKLDSSYYADLLKELLIDNTHTATVWCLPSCTLGQRRTEAEKQRIAQECARWSDKDLERILLLNESLSEWQQTPDTAENLAKLPSLALSEINPAPEKLITESAPVNGVTVLRHPSTARGISYISLYFDASDIAQGDIPAASLMCSLLGKLPTSDRTVSELDREIKTHIGNLKFELNAFGSENTPDSCKAALTVRCSILEDEYDNIIPILADILTNTRFDRIDEIRKLVSQQYDLTRRSIISSGHLYALYRSLSGFSAESSVRELADGYEYYRFLRTLSADEDAIEPFAALAEQLVSRFFCSSRLTISITADGMRQDPEKLINAFPAGSKSACESFAPALCVQRHEALEIPAAVSFAAMGLNVHALDAKYSAELRLLGHIMSYNYLWNAIRVQGGAYGAGMQITPIGNACYYTYRDPNGGRSLGIFGKASGFLKEFCSGDEALDKFIIGCISRLDPLLSAMDKGIAADGNLFRNISYEQRCALWSSLISTDKSKLLSLAQLLDGIAQNGSVCLIGSKDILKEYDTHEFAQLTY